MNFLLLTITHICVAILTGCAVSICKDYKSDNGTVCKNIKRLKTVFKSKLSGIVAGAFCLTLSTIFAMLLIMG